MSLISQIVVRERGATPGITKREFPRLSKQAWQYAALKHHRENTAKRFTDAHARRAGYTPRAGQRLPRSSKQFWRRYYGRKLRSSRHGGGRNQARPLVYSGTSERLAQFPTMTATKSGAKLKFRTRAFNRRNPNSNVDMNAEFRKVLPSEQQDVARNYDKALDQGMNNLRAQKKQRVKT